MANLTRASRELFRRPADERFASLTALSEHCHRQKDQSRDLWHPPQALSTSPVNEQLQLQLGSDGAFELNDWSFTQLCRLANVNKDTVNRLTPATASQVFAETLTRTGKPLQVLTTGQAVRSLHGVAYTRLWNADLLATIHEAAPDFQPPPKGFNGATGLYAGEQDLFCFLIDPTGWVDINGESFAPGFFCWNSEVGRRSVGISTFWFQRVCTNHIVWDAIEVTEVKRKHTANVYDSLAEIRSILTTLVKQRDERKDGFAAMIKLAMTTTLGTDPAEVLKVLATHDIHREAGKQAIELAQMKGGLTVWALVDALTQLTRGADFAGDRIEADQRAAALFALAA